ncbi:hypothetical protein K2P47_05010 [Patescibacteria group bacterium]|nr:hypothetical protein [Patescibacteria group bacterium]
MQLNGEEIHPLLVEVMLRRVISLFENEAEAVAAIAKVLPRLTEAQQSTLMLLNEYHRDLAPEIEALRYGYVQTVHQQRLH